MLVIVVSAVLGGVSLYSLNSLESSVVSYTDTALENQAYSTMAAGIMNDKKLVEFQLDYLKSDALRLAGSNNLKNYFLELSGKNSQKKDLVVSEARATVKGVYNFIKNQSVLVEKKLRLEMEVSSRMADDMGGFALLPEKSHAVEAVNQFTQQKRSVSLPGYSLIQGTGNPSELQELAADISARFGLAATIFQRMDEDGDMLRVATTVRKKDGTFAIGTYIPAVNPDNTKNKVVSTLLSGKVYTGRAFVVDKWYISVYMPVVGDKGKVIGAIYIGTPESENKEISSYLRSIKVGKSGYVFAMDSHGLILNHPKSSLLHKTVGRDIDVGDLIRVLGDLKDGKVGIIEYDFENRRKYAAYVYYKKWDWVICCTGYLDEVSAQAVEEASDLVVDEFEAVAASAVFETATEVKNLYTRLRVCDDKGKVIFSAGGGEAGASVAVGGEEWFKQAQGLKKGGVLYSKVDISKLDKLPIIRAITPIVIDKERYGWLVVSMDWDVMQSLLKDHTYGRTGYAYLLNGEGFLISHPKYNLKDRVNLADSKNGKEVARVIKDGVLRKKKGVDEYTFEGIRKFAAYIPIKIGRYEYFVIATAPVSEYLVISEKIKAFISKQGTDSFYIFLVSCIVLAVLAILLSFILSRKFTRPITRITDALTEMARGNLRVDFKHNSKDEIGVMARAYNDMLSAQKVKAGIAQSIAEGDLTVTANPESENDELGQALQTMTEKLREIIGRIQEVGYRVNSGSSQISKASINLSQGATEQASSLEEVTSTITEFGTQVTHNAQNSNSASSLSTDARAAAEKGNAQMLDMVEAMEEIRESSSKVTQIIKVINDIAFQTNLLALNAAVEAARAGQHGKGFAVVAEEVRNLASRSAKAANETEALILGSGAKIDNGAKLAEQTAGILQEIVDSISKVNEIAVEISSSSNEQATGVTQINQSLEQIAEVTHQNTANAEQTASSATELASEAEHLQQLLSTFHLHTQSGGFGDEAQMSYELEGESFTALPFSDE